MVPFYFSGIIVDTHAAVSSRLSDLIQLLINSESDSHEADVKEEITEMYLLLGALLQRTYQLTIRL